MLYIFYLFDLKSLFLSRWNAGRGRGSLARRGHVTRLLSREARRAASRALPRKPSISRTLGGTNEPWNPICAVIGRRGAPNGRLIGCGDEVRYGQETNTKRFSTELTEERRGSMSSSRDSSWEWFSGNRKVAGSIPGLRLLAECGGVPEQDTT